MKRVSMLALLLIIVMISTSIIPDHVLRAQDDDRYVIITAGDYRLEIRRIFEADSANGKSPDRDIYLILDIALYNDSSDDYCFRDADFRATVGELANINPDDLNEVREEFFPGRDYPGGILGQCIDDSSHALSLLEYDLPNNVSEITINFAPDDESSSFTLLLERQADGDYGFALGVIEGGTSTVMTLTPTPTYPPTSSFSTVETSTEPGVVLISTGNCRLEIVRIRSVRDISGEPSNRGVILIFEIMLRNERSSEVTFYGRDFLAHIGDEEFELEHLADVRNSFYLGIDYPGFTNGQTVRGNDAQESLLVYDVPADLTAITLEFNPDGFESQFTLWLERQPFGEYRFGLESVAVGDTGLATYTPAPASVNPRPPSRTPAPSRTVPPAQTNTPAAQGVTVTAPSSVNLRGGPGTNYPITGALSTGESRQATARNGDWLVVGVNQWVASWVVTVDGNVSSLSVMTAPPAPVQQPPAQQPPAAQSTPPPAAAPVPGAAESCLTGFDFSVCPQYAPAPANCDEVVARGISARVAACCFPARDRDKDGVACYGD